jgi:hypothetical protein
MITVLALLAGGALLAALGAAAARDLFRQTAAWSARHDPTPHGWTSVDDAQIARLLQHPAMPSEARNRSALSSEE